MAVIVQLIGLLASIALKLTEMGFRLMLELLKVAVNVIGSLFDSLVARRKERAPRARPHQRRRRR